MNYYNSTLQQVDTARRLCVLSNKSSSTFNGQRKLVREATVIIVSKIEVQSLDI